METTERSIHSSALAGVQPDPERSEYWLEAYENAKTVSERIRVLHHGFGYLPLTFYLQEADGHNDYEHYFLSDAEIKERFRYFDHGEGLVKSRRAIARKAFDMLVGGFFRNSEEKRYLPPSWLGQIVHNEKLLKAILHFFRLDEEQRFVNLNHLVPDHKREIVREFLLTLARYAWEGLPNEGSRYDDEMEKFLSKYRMELIDILCGLGRLDMLLRVRYTPVTEQVLQKLTELALGKELSFSGVASGFHSDHRNHCPETIEIATYLGSQAGQVALVLRAKLAVHKKFEEIAEARQESEAAERRLRELAAR